MGVIHNMGKQHCLNYVIGNISRICSLSLLNLFSHTDSGGDPIIVQLNTQYFDSSL